MVGKKLPLLKSTAEIQMYKCTFFGQYETCSLHCRGEDGIKIWLSSSKYIITCFDLFHVFPFLFLPSLILLPIFMNLPPGCLSLRLAAAKVGWPSWRGPPTTIWTPPRRGKPSTSPSLPSPPSPSCLERPPTPWGSTWPGRCLLRSPKTLLLPHLTQVRGEKEGDQIKVLVHLIYNI